MKTPSIDIVKKFFNIVNKTKFDISYSLLKYLVWKKLDY